jgi:hypothetical protein
MRLLFVYYLMDDRGSAQDIRSYVQTGRTLGHEVAMYGASRSSSFEFSRDVASADGLVFVFEWTTGLLEGNNLDFARMLGKFPRSRRVVIDCDGNYNDRLSVDGDYNHRNDEDSRRWREICDSLSDKICQPTFHPRCGNVRTFLFHGYDRTWARPLNSRPKEFGMVYIGHSKFRWNPLHRLLKGIEPIRDRLGKITLVGHGWNRLPDWADSMRMQDAYFVDYDYLKKLDIEIMEPVPYDRVIDLMGKGLFTPVLYRPLFSQLQFVTCRTFETPAAATIPLFDLDNGYVQEIYGDNALELVLDGNPERVVSDVLRRPHHYFAIVKAVRCHLADHHSYAARLKELIDILMD